MLKTITFHLFFAGFVLSLSAPALARLGGGGMDSGGGSGLTLIFRKEGVRAAKIISQLRNFPLSSEEFEKIVHTTRLEIHSEPLLDLNGRKVVALVSRVNRVVSLHEETVIRILFAPSTSLSFVVHQYLRVAGIDDTDYKFSRLIEQGADQVTVSVLCTAAVEEDLLKLAYKESTSSFDSSIQTPSALFTLQTKVGSAEYSHHLISKNESGVLITVNFLGIFPLKILLPADFLSGKKQQVKIGSYIVKETAPGIRQYEEFICEHVNKSQSPEVPTIPEATPQPADPVDPEIADAVRKNMENLMRQQIMRMVSYVAHSVPAVPGFPLSEQTMKELIQTTTLEFTDETLRDQEGVIVDALNYPSRKLIRFNYGRLFLTLTSPLQALQLIIHEYLGIAGFDDRDYAVSGRIIHHMGETKLEIACQIEQDGKLIPLLKYREIDYDNDGSGDHFEILRRGSDDSTQQLPLVSRNKSFTGEIEGALLLWVSGSYQETYQSFLPKEAWKTGGDFSIPYFRTPPGSEPDFSRPSGQLVCSAIKK